MNHQERPENPAAAPIDSPRDLAARGTFSLILNFEGVAVERSKSPETMGTTTGIQDQAVAIGDEIAEEMRRHLRPQLPSAEVSVTIGFQDSLSWSGILLITDTVARISENPAFSEYVRKLTETLVNRILHDHLDRWAAGNGKLLKRVGTRVTAGRTQLQSRPRTNFLWWCAGVMPETLQMYPSEKAKYEGIGGAVLTTGALAFLSGTYAVYTTLASGSYALVTSAAFGILWAIAIFNLDRYIVSSLRKPTDANIRWRQRLARTWFPAIPRLGLAILIGITLSRPIELRLFQNAIAGQAAINRDQAVETRRASLTASSELGRVDADLATIIAQLAEAENRVATLEDEFRRETDGTGGSRRIGYSEVARVKEAAAVQARRDLVGLQSSVQDRLNQLQTERDEATARIQSQVETYRQSLAEDFLTRMRALADLSANSPAVRWISTFVMLLIIGIEITPVLVKLLSPVGPYDVKVDAMNRVENHEAILKRDTSIRVADHHYERVEKTELRANDHLAAIQPPLVVEALDAKAEQWKKAKGAGSTLTMDQWLGEVRTEILTQRGS